MIFFVHWSKIFYVSFIKFVLCVIPKHRLSIKKCKDTRSLSCGLLIPWVTWYLGRMIQVPLHSQGAEDSVQFLMFHCSVDAFHSSNSSHPQNSFSFHSFGRKDKFLIFLKMCIDEYCFIVLFLVKFMNQSQIYLESVILDFSSEVLPTESLVKVDLFQVYRSLHRFSPNTKLQTNFIHS